MVSVNICGMCMYEYVCMSINVFMCMNVWMCDYVGVRVCVYVCMCVKDESAEIKVMYRYLINVH